MNLHDLQILVVVVVLLFFGAAGAVIGWFFGTKRLYKRSYDALGPPVGFGRIDRTLYARRKRARLISTAAFALAGIVLGFAALLSLRL